MGCAVRILEAARNRREAQGQDAQILARDRLLEEMGASGPAQGVDLLVAVDQREDGGQREIVLAFEDADIGHGVGDAFLRHVVVENDQSPGGAAVKRLRFLGAPGFDDFMGQFIQIIGQYLSVRRDVARHDDAQGARGQAGQRFLVRFGRGGNGLLFDAGGEPHAERNGGSLGAAFERDEFPVGPHEFPCAHERQGAAFKGRHTGTRIRNGEQQMAGIGAFGQALGTDLHHAAIGGEYRALDQQGQHVGELGASSFVAAGQVGGGKP